MPKPEHCALCGRAVEVLTRHHLIPRTRHKNKKNKELFDRDTVKEIIWVCRACHDTIHAALTEKQLERDYNTVEALATHPEIKKFVDWIRDKPETIGVRVRTKHKR